MENLKNIHLLFLIGSPLVVLLGAFLNINYKVRRHDKVIYKEKGGLNIVDNGSCQKNMDGCISGVRAVIREEMREYHKNQETKLILEELRKLNEKGGGE